MIVKKDITVLSICFSNLVFSLKKNKAPCAPPALHRGQAAVGHRGTPAQRLRKRPRHSRHDADGEPRDGGHLREKAEGRESGGDVPSSSRWRRFRALLQQRDVFSTQRRHRPGLSTSKRSRRHLAEGVPVHFPTRVFFADGAGLWMFRARSGAEYESEQHRLERVHVD